MYKPFPSTFGRLASRSESESIRKPTGSARNKEKSTEINTVTKWLISRAKLLGAVKFRFPNGFCLLQLLHESLSHIQTEAEKRQIPRREINLTFSVLGNGAQAIQRTVAQNLLNSKKKIKLARHCFSNEYQYPEVSNRQAQRSQLQWTLLKFCKFR